MAKLLAIAIRPQGEDVMKQLTLAELTPENGLLGDKRSRPGRRQITLMNLSDWNKACEEVATDLHWTTRRANLLVDHLDLFESTGARIHIGDVLLEVTGETDPCEKMEVSCRGLFQALKPDWRGGVTCKVIKGGNFSSGDDVVLKHKE